jgi:hypothetical protein
MLFTAVRLQQQEEKRMERYRALGVSRLVLAILAVPLLLAACGDSSKGPEIGVKPGKITVPKLDPNAPFPALSGATLDALATDVPELAKVKDTLLAAERGAIKGVLEKLKAKPEAARKKAGAARSGPFSLAPLLPPSPAADAGHFSLISTARAAEVDLSALGEFQQFVIGSSVSRFFGEALETGAKGKADSKPIAGDKGSAISATASVSSEGVMGMEISTKITVPVFVLDANSKVKLSGDFCPSPEGKVEFSINYSNDGRAGSGGSTIYDRSIEAKVTIAVGDDAEIVNADIELKQATRSTAGGRQVYVETSQSGRMKGGDYNNVNFGPLKVIRQSSQVEAAKDSKLVEDGLNQAYYLAIGAMTAAQGQWKDGKCVKIDASSPGTVQPGTTSKIPVAVKHKRDGSSVPAKVVAKLTGGASVTPTTIAKAPGDVTHVAVKERQKSMTIALTATSKRGKDTLELKISTGGLGYTADGGGPGLTISGKIDDVSKPFSLKGQGQGFTLALEYTPASEKGGTMTYHGTGGGVVLSGKGPYTIAETDSVRGGRSVLTLNAKPTGCVTGPGIKNCRTTNQVVTLTPTD